MKKLLIMLFLASCFALDAKKVTVESKICYCSDKCGPRDITENDAPFVDQETGIFFCLQRDKDNFDRTDENGENLCVIPKEPRKKNNYRKAPAPKAPVKKASTQEASHVKTPAWAY